MSHPRYLKLVSWCNETWRFKSSGMFCCFDWSTA